MRSLWPDLGPVENTLSELQEVSPELAATSGTCNPGRAGPLSPVEVSMTSGG